jgi:hypothetical protein
MDHEIPANKNAGGNLLNPLTDTCNDIKNDSLNNPQSLFSGSFKESIVSY